MMNEFEHNKLPEFIRWFLALVGKYFLFLLRLGGAILILCTLFGFLSKYGFVLDLLSQFRLQYAIALLMILLFCFIKRAQVHKYEFMMVAIALLINAALIVQYYIPLAKQSQAGGKELKILQMNVLYCNTNYQDVISTILSSNSDIACLQEVTGQWQEILLDSLSQTYPYHLISSREDSFGMAIFSKYPLLESQEVHLGETASPNFFTNVNFCGKLISIVDTHFLPPVRLDTFFYQRQQAKMLAKLIKANTNPVIVVGDLNSTSWSETFRTVIDAKSLRDTRYGFGLQCSWPTPLGPLGITIDHILVSPQIDVVNRQLLNPSGSDHFPVLCTLRFNNSLAKLSQ
jgi:endonuclease/exonuclease/phosphatase (EEP) superfamily protein YafD